MSHSKHVNAYAGHQNVQIDGREIDKRALLNCAAKLKDALDNGGKDFKMYQDAIRHNQNLWTCFQVALVDPTNPLNQDLKLTLLRLSGYVDRVSFRAITEFMPDILNSLIDINRIIAAGLAKKPQQPAKPAGESAGTSAMAATMPVHAPMAVSTSA